MNVTWWSVFGFALAVLPICLTPGVSFTLVTQRVIDRGVRSGFLVITGTAGGILCHAVLAGAGLSALVMRSSEAFTAVKLAGAVYLIGLGCGRYGGHGRPRYPHSLGGVITGGSGFSRGVDKATSCKGSWGMSSTPRPQPCT